MNHGQNVIVKLPLVKFAQAKNYGLEIVAGVEGLY
jgi:hypothetical protein